MGQPSFLVTTKSSKNLYLKSTRDKIFIKNLNLKAHYHYNKNKNQNIDQT